MKVLQILLAEDNQGDVYLVREALKQYVSEHQLHIARDGAEALQFLSKAAPLGDEPCPDVLLLDLNLPKIDGSEVLAQFRRHPECASTPVVVLTSSGAMRDREQMASLGISHYFQKPSDYEAFMKLGAVVKEVLASSEESLPGA